MVDDSSQNTTKISGTEALWRSNEDLYTIRQTKYSWKCQLTPNAFWMVEEGNQPNWLHRKMQTLCFGIKWTKI
jgi:hypothetical protein